MKKVRLLIGLLLIAALNGICLADAGLVPSKENAELKARIEKLEKELAELKYMVMQQKEGTPPVEKPAPAPVAPAAEKKPVVSGLDIQIYGRLKFDAAYDTSRTDNGNYVKWVLSETDNKHDNEFNMTANESRLGMWIYGPKDGDLKTSGRVEVDFFEGGAENKSRLMMRHAYLNLDWPQDKFSILAGQTSDVISPLFPYTLNYSVAWWAGNIGYRRPQIRLTKGYALNKDVDLKLEGAIARTIGLSSGSFTPGDAGEDAGIPGFQGRASLTFPWLAYKPTTIGFSGHWAKEEYDTDANGTNKKFDSWSLNLDVLQPINEWLTIKGEMFTGKNLSAYLGGIGQGVRNIGTASAPVYDKEIGSTGGWIAAELGPWDKWKFNLGVTIDDVENGDLRGGVDKREYNRSIFGNVIYSLDKNAQIGFELSQWHTEYQGEGNADAIRAQTSFIYNF
ncbi:MAG: DcaP family trimeric outer membrane transporter [Planctomycetota bacterium]